VERPCTRSEPDCQPLLVQIQHLRSSFEPLRAVVCKLSVTSINTAQLHHISHHNHVTNVQICDNVFTLMSMTRLKLHYTNFPITSQQRHETGKSLTGRQLVTDLLPDFISMRGSYGHRHDTTFACRPVTVHGSITSLTLPFCASAVYINMSNVIFNSADLFIWHSE